MSELRLIPAALMCWACALLVLCGLGLLAWILVALAVAIGAVAKFFGQGVIIAAVGAISAAVSKQKMLWAQESELGEKITGQLVSAAKDKMLRLNVDGVPGTLPVFVEELPGSLPAGAKITIRAQLKDSDRPAVMPWIAQGEVDNIEPPSGFAAWADAAAENFRQAVEQAVGPASQGLIPGIVLGDVSLQDSKEEQLYIDTGLSHLSAVSGANVTIVMTAAFLCARALGLGPRCQAGFALAALLLFAGLVGPEPSVLRASVAGFAGVMAIMNSSRMQPVHALSLGVIGLILYDSDLAASYGFALSVAATASIIALVPVFYRTLSPLGWPDTLIRALSVAVAADIATMPLISLMAGEVSVVSVLANVLVSPATVPITVLGLVAAIWAQLPVPGVDYALKIVEPFSWWIHQIALGCQSLPVATIPAHPWMVLLAYGWIVAGLIYGHPWKVLLIVVAGLASFYRPVPPVSAWPTDPARIHAVETDEDIDPVPEGTEIIVVYEAGRSFDHPSRTEEGIPVIYPNRQEQ